MEDCRYTLANIFEGKDTQRVSFIFEQNKFARIFASKSSIYFGNVSVLFKHTTFLDIITTIYKVISRIQEIQKKCQNLGLKLWKEMNNQCPQFMQLSTERSLWISLNRAGLGCLISHVFLLGGIRRSSPSPSKHSFQLCNLKKKTNHNYFQLWCTNEKSKTHPMNIIIWP